jgi:hypothetical protein
MWDQIIIIEELILFVSNLIKIFCDLKFSLKNKL